MLSVDLWCIRIILNDAVFTLRLVKHCDYVHLQKTTQSPHFQHSVRQWHTFSYGESGAAPPLSCHGKDIRSAHVLAQRGQEWQRVPRSSNIFYRIRTYSEPFSEKYTGNVFSSLFHFSITGGCFLHLCPWNMPFYFQLNCTLLKFLPVNLPSLHPSAVLCYWAVFLSLRIILMIFYLSYLIWGS